MFEFSAKAGVHRLRSCKGIHPAQASLWFIRYARWIPSPLARDVPFVLDLCHIGQPWGCGCVKHPKCGGVPPILGGKPQPHWRGYLDREPARQTMLLGASANGHPASGATRGHEHAVPHRQERPMRNPTLASRVLVGQAGSLVVSGQCYRISIMATRKTYYGGITLCGH